VNGGLSDPGREGLGWGWALWAAHISYLRSEQDSKTDYMIYAFVSLKQKSNGQTDRTNQKIPTYEKMPKDFEVLTSRQRAFVMAMFTLADPSIVDCVRAAGYKDNGDGDPAPHAQGQS